MDWLHVLRRWLRLGPRLPSHLSSRARRLVCLVCVCRDWAQYASTDLGAQASDRLIPDQYIVVFKGYEDLVQGAGLVQTSVLASGKAGSVLGQFNSCFIYTSDAADDLNRVVTRVVVADKKNQNSLVASQSSM